jgi:diguanylate cyclase (GGDEF)-like protein
MGAILAESADPHRDNHQGMKLSVTRLFVILFVLIEALGTLLLFALYHVSRNEQTEAASAPFVRQVATAVAELDRDVSILAGLPGTVACIESRSPDVCQSHASAILAYHPRYSVRFVPALGQEIVAFSTQGSASLAQRAEDFRLAAGLALQSSHEVRNAGGDSIGRLVVEQPIPHITALFESLPSGFGYAELRQYAAGGGFSVLVRKGNEELGKKAPAVMADIAHSPWKVALWSHSTSTASLLGIPAYFAVWLTFTVVLAIIVGLTHSALRGNIQGDLNALVGLVHDIRRNRLQADYSVRLQEFEQSLSLLKKMGRLMVGRQLEVTAQATLDHLSQVHNRRSFEARQRKIFRTLAEGFPHSLLLLDIDRFKHVNDTYGHDAGDRLIVEFGKALKDNLRASDFIARLGGDEFCVIFPNTPLGRAAELAERLRKKMPRTVELGSGIRHELRFSAGLAAYDRNDRGETAALARADAALLDAKREGRNITRVKAA